MTDIALRWNASNQADIAADGSDLATDDGLETAVIISLFTDRRVREDEELPAGETYRRGWWGDVDAAPGDQTGSRLWLLHREKQMTQVVARAKEYAEEALQWLLDDKIAASVEVEVDGDTYERLSIGVSIRKPKGDMVKYRFGSAWIGRSNQ